MGTSLSPEKRIRNSKITIPRRDDGGGQAAGRRLGRQRCSQRDWSKASCRTRSIRPVAMLHVESNSVLGGHPNGLSAARSMIRPCLGTPETSVRGTAPICARFPLEDAFVHCSRALRRLVAAELRCLAPHRVWTSFFLRSSRAVFEPIPPGQTPHCSSTGGF